MKRRMFTALCLVALIAAVAYGPSLQPADARIGDVMVHKLLTPPEGYSVTVCSSWVNNTDIGGGLAGTVAEGYRTITPPAGNFFELIQIYAVKAGAAQWCSLNVWSSTTDSSMASTKSDGTAAMPLNWQSAESGLVAEIRMRCVKASFSCITSLDDIYVIGYARDY